MSIRLDEDADTQRSVADSEASLRSIVNQTMAGIAQTDLSGRFVFVNDRYCNLVGRTREEMSGLRMQDITHPDDLPNNVGLFERVVAEGTPFAIEKRYIHGDGSHIWVSNSVSRIVDAEGAAQGVLAVSIDITARKRAEARDAYLLRLADILRPLASPLAIQEMAARELGECLGADRVFYVEIDPNENDVLIRQDYAPRVPSVAGRHQIESFGKHFVNALRAGEPFSVADVRDTTEPGSPEREAFDALMVRSFVAVSLRKEGRLVALLGVHRCDRYEWPAHEVSLVTETAERTWAAVERAMAEAALRDSERSLSTLISNLPGLVFRCLNDETWTMVFMSDGAMDVTGHPAGDFLSKRVTWDSLIHPEDLDRVRSDAAKHIEEQTPIRITYRIADAAGGVRWVWDRSTPLFSGEGEIVCWEGFVTDVTERKQIEDALRESEARFREMADNAPVMIWVTDPAGSCTYLSKSWYEFTGQTPATGLGFGWGEAVHPDDRANVQSMFVAANERREGFRLDYRLRRHDGEYRWAIDAATARIGPGGEFLGHIGSVIDITDRKRIEQALLETDRMKDEFLATLSHELRTPLTSIVGWAQLLSTGAISSQEQEVGLEAIRASAHAQSRLIEDVLDVSRVITGKMRLELQPTDLPKLVGATVATLRPAAEAKRTPLTIVVDPLLPLHVVDPGRIQQIVWNLVSNAIKFSPPGAAIAVTVRGEGSASVIEVLDHGRGIHPAFLPHVFERFRQADSSAKRSHTGLGLGLALVKELTELHGGTVHVDSEVGLGSCFTVRLPLLEPATGGEEVAREGSRSEQDRASLNGLHLIYVDDLSETRLLIAKMLRQLGADVVESASVDDAIAAVKERVPDVIVTDIAMPERDGYDLLESIRGSALWSAIPVVALTAHGGIDDERRAAAAGFSGFVRKPFQLEELTSALAHAIRSDDSRRLSDPPGRH